MGDRQQELPCPAVLPEPGDRLKIVHGFRTLAENDYLAGDELHLLRRTYEAPHGRVSSLGNWRVKDKFMTSIWTNIEFMMAQGMVEVIK